MELTRESLLASTELPQKTVEVPGLGTVRVRTLMGCELDAYESGNRTVGPDGKVTPNFANMRARLVVACVCKENGEPVFGPDDVEGVGQIAAPKLDKIFDACAELNGMTKRSREDAEKNSGKAPAEGSSSS